VAGLNGRLGLLARSRAVWLSRPDAVPAAILNRRSVVVSVLVPIAMKYIVLVIPLAQLKARRLSMANGPNGEIGLNALLHAGAVSVRALVVATAHTRKMADQVNFKIFFLNSKQITKYFTFVYLFIFLIYLECSGCGVEYSMCNLHACSETKRVTTWTPWLLANDTDIGRIERRFRFSCKAPVDTSLLKVGAMKLEERICHADGTCLRTGMFFTEDLDSM
jgi:hypothetical protein